jgi:sensor domain CHASE-containing protein
VELLIFEVSPRLVSFPYGLLTFDKSFDRLGRPFGRTIDRDLAKHQRKLTNGVDRVVIRIIEQETTASIEHTIKETSEKSGETSMPRKTLEHSVIHDPLV